jgi:hypothetical protein
MLAKKIIPLSDLWEQKNSQDEHALTLLANTHNDLEWLKQLTTFILEHYSQEEFLNYVVGLIHCPKTSKAIKDYLSVTLVAELATDRLSLPTTAIDSEDTDVQKAINAYQFVLGNMHPDAIKFKQLYDLILSGGHKHEAQQEVPVWTLYHSHLLKNFYRTPQNILAPAESFNQLFLEEMRTQALLYITQLEKAEYGPKPQSSYSLNSHRFMPPATAKPIIEANEINKGHNTP